jgi:hypothetical protein
LTKVQPSIDHIRYVIERAIAHFGRALSTCWTVRRYRHGWIGWGVLCGAIARYTLAGQTVTAPTGDATASFTVSTEQAGPHTWTLTELNHVTGILNPATLTSRLKAGGIISLGGIQLTGL